MNSDNTRTIELTVSRKSIIDKYAEWLAATKVVLPNEEVTNIDFGILFANKDINQDLVPIKVTINGTKQEAVTVH